MKTITLTIRLGKELDRLLSEASRRTGRNKSDLVREAIRRQLPLDALESLRKRITPFV